MATFAVAVSLDNRDIHTFTVDFTNDLPAGGTVTAGTASHVPPYGSVNSLTTSVSSPYMFGTLPVQTIKGVHYIDVQGTFNNGDKSSVRIPINIGFHDTQARSGMAELILELRALGDCSPDDYKIAGVPYWSDAQLQKILDNNRSDLKWSEMEAQEEADSSWLDYAIGYGNLEQTSGGTAIFIVQDVNGETVTADYTVDYQRGVVTFAEDTGGTDYWVTARSYDLNGAAADVWRKKQVHYHMAVDFSTDNHSVKRSQLYQHALEMAQYYEQLGGGGFGTMEVMRSDTDDG